MSNRLDQYSIMPSGMREYLSLYGWHFSKKMCDFAVSRMRTMDATTGKTKAIEPMGKDEVESLLTKYGVKLDKNEGYDIVYAANMCKADYLKSSVTDEAHLAMFVKDYVDDADGYEGMPLTRFLADCIGGGVPIVWHDMI